MAFSVRAHNHLWGKNNEDPLVFLYDKGLTHEFSRQMYLGWNKFGQERPYDRWGIQKAGKFFIPPGIVFPYIMDKELISLFIIPMDQRESVFSFPGNPPRPVILGNPDNEIKPVEDLLQGIFLFQDPDTRGVKIRI